MADLKGCRAGKTPPPERLARRLADKDAAHKQEHAEAAARLKRRYG